MTAEPSFRLDPSPPAKRSLTLSGHRTSVSLEPVFWDALRRHAAATGLSVNALAARIDAIRPPELSLASALRQFLAQQTPVQGGPTMTLSPQTRERLSNVSTATISTALFKRGLRNQTIQNVHPLGDAGPMVGPAYTLRYIPAREDLNPITVFENPDHPQRAGVEQCPEGAVFVIDSRGDARAASAGSILVTRLMVRGCAGIVTDGGFRDAPEIAKMEIPSYHQRPSAPTNLTRHQAVDLNVPIACGEAPVWPGDIIVGDAEAVIVIPADIVDEIAEEATNMTLFETFVTEEVQKGRSIIGLYPPTQQQSKDDFEAWKAKRNA